MARKKQKLKTFTTYCDKPYDRNKYKMVMKNGKALVLEDYDQVRQLWYQFRTQMVRVDILDK